MEEKNITIRLTEESYYKFASRMNVANASEQDVNIFEQDVLEQFVEDFNANVESISDANLSESLTFKSREQLDKVFAKEWFENSKWRKNNSGTWLAKRLFDTGLLGKQFYFISSHHDYFFFGKVVEFKERYHEYPDEYHKALFYCLGINRDTRQNFDRIYDWQADCIKPECLKEPWQTSGSMKVTRMAFSLFSNGTPSVNENEAVGEQLHECRQYTAEELFCCAYAPFFWQAIRIRYPEYETYDREVYKLLGGLD